MKRVTAIGEILWDIYPDKKRLGGAPFNFIYHVWKILGSSDFISNVGNDENGKEMLSHLSSIGFDISAISIDDIHPTGTVKVELDDNKIPHFKISSECCFDHLRLNDVSRNIFENETDILYFGTFTARKGVSRQTLLSLLNREDKKYFCDLNLRHNFYSKELIGEILQTCNVIKINQEELDKLKLFFSLEKENDRAIQQLFSKYNLELIGLTLGENGAVLFTRTENNFYKSGDIKVIDTLGAGDAFASIMCLGYLRNLQLADINKYANEFAAEICMIQGALPEDDTIYNKYRKIFS